MTAADDEPGEGERGHPREHRARTSAQRVGRYLLRERIASGGMGVVYRAHAVGAAGVVKELCVKRLGRQVLVSKGALERFVEEARLSMALNHANIVTVFDFGEAEDGYYLAMEWVDGVDLARLLARSHEATRPFPLAVAAYVGADVARALDHAHRAAETGIVHRDVKPSNVLVSRAGEVKLADFGVAVAFGADDGARVGTPEYMAPEQARGQRISHKADLYALGKVVLEMVHGSRVVDIASTLPFVDPELRPLLDSLLALDPSDRPEDARWVAAKLERIASREVAGGFEPPREWLARNVLERRSAVQGEKIRPSWTSFASFAPTSAATLGDGTNAATEPSASSRQRARGDLPSADTAAPSTGRALALGAAIVVAALIVAAGVLVGGSFPRPSPAERGAARDVAASPPTPAPPARPAPRPEAPAETLEERVAPTLADEPAGPPRADAAAASTRSRTEARTGSLSVAARPWAKVYIDGRPVGVTPVLMQRLRAGTHSVRLENDVLGITRALEVEVPADEHRRLSVDLR